MNHEGKIFFSREEMEQELKTTIERMSGEELAKIHHKLYDSEAEVTENGFLLSIPD